jgi:hypothetical protein
LPRDRLGNRISVLVEVVADCRPNEVRTILIEAVIHQQIDATEIDMTQIDGNFFAILRFRSQLVHAPDHLPSSYHLIGWYMADD